MLDEVAIIQQMIRSVRRAISDFPQFDDFNRLSYQTLTEDQLNFICAAAWVGTKNKIYEEWGRQIKREASKQEEEKFWKILKRLDIDINN